MTSASEKDELSSDSDSSNALNYRLKYLQINYWTLVALLISIDVLGPFATDAHLPSLPVMTTDLHTNPAWIQFTVIAYAIIMAFSSLFGGYLSDKFGRRNVTLFGLVFFIVGNYGCSISPSIEILIACRIVQGFGGGISTIITQSIARDVFEQKTRMRILAILGSVRPIGIAAAPMIFGVVGEFYGWRNVFVATATCGVISFIFALLKLPETRNVFFDERHNSINPSVVDHDISYISVWKIACNDKIFLTLSWTMAFRMVGVFVFLTEFPFVSRDYYQYSMSITGFLIGIGAIFLLAGSGFAVYLDSKFMQSHDGEVEEQDINSQTLPNNYSSCGDDTRHLKVANIVSVVNFVNSCSNSPLSSNSALLEIKNQKNIIFCKSKLRIIRIAAVCSLVSFFALIFIPIFLHFNEFELLFSSAKESSVIDISQINDEFTNDLSEEMDGKMFELKKIYVDNEWYLIVIPFCMFTFSQGLSMPAFGTISLEPYPHLAASMSSISMFWRIFLPAILLLLVTQLLSFQTYALASIIIHFILGGMALLCFLLIFLFIKDEDIYDRMSGHLVKVSETDSEISDSEYRIGNVTVVQSEDEDIQ